MVVRKLRVHAGIARMRRRIHKKRARFRNIRVSLGGDRREHDDCDATARLTIRHIPRHRPVPARSGETAEAPLELL
jgi:hypothetical protein